MTQIDPTALDDLVREKLLRFARGGLWKRLHDDVERAKTEAWGRDAYVDALTFNDEITVSAVWHPLARVGVARQMIEHAEAELSLIGSERAA